MTVICPYCQGPAAFVDSVEVYRRSYGMIYLCRPCRAWVGVHKGTDRALGRLANEPLRQAKRLAHANFDQLWQNRPNHVRRLAYAAMGEVLGIAKEQCHIGMFDLADRQRVVIACEYGLIGDAMAEMAEAR